MTIERLKEFFCRYESFFMKSLYEEIDSEEILNLYASEFIAATPLGVMTGKNDDDFKQALFAGYEQYRKMGTKKLCVRDVKMTPIDERHCLADAEWTATYEKTDGTRIDIDFQVHYLMQEKDENLRIFGWIAGDEQELLKKSGVI